MAFNIYWYTNLKTTAPWYSLHVITLRLLIITYIYTIFKYILWNVNNWSQIIKAHLSLVEVQSPFAHCYFDRGVSGFRWYVHAVSTLLYGNPTLSCQFGFQWCVLKFPSICVEVGKIVTFHGCYLFTKRIKKPYVMIWYSYLCHGTICILIKVKENAVGRPSDNANEKTKGCSKLLYSFQM